MDLTCKLRLILTVGLKKEHCAFDLYTISSQKQGDGYEIVCVFFFKCSSRTTTEKHLMGDRDCYYL